MRATLIALTVLIALGAGALSARLIDLIWSPRGELSDGAIALIAERIIQVESGGNPRARNARSTATGAGQFIEATWLELARKHLPDLNGLSDADVLKLRYDLRLSRDITVHLIRRNATLLRNRGLPATPANLYLAHFAGGAGAAAVLSAPQNADAALTMAEADASGRTSRERLVKANPLLEGMTTKDLKKWAEHKMRGRR